MTTAAIPRPGPSEYVPYYETYISKVPKGNLLKVLEDQRRETQELLAGVSEAKGLHRYAPGKWSVKEVVGHLMDSERVFCYRALGFGRADESPLPGFDAEALARRGTANNNPITARALAWIIAGHERHHVAILRERYLA